MAELTQLSYRQMLWEHRPLTDFWRIGPGISRKLEGRGLFTMGDVARCSLACPELLFKLFGVNAQFLIDHAWGWESCTIADIKAYQPRSSSLSSGQVLSCAYDWAGGRLIVQEMADGLVLELMAKGLETDQIVLTLGYDRQSLETAAVAEKYAGQLTKDHYGRTVPKSAHGSVNLGGFSASGAAISQAILELYGRIAQKDLLIRKVTLTANHTRRRGMEEAEQLDLFGAYIPREEKRQQAVLDIRSRFGKNALVRGMNLQQGATAMARNAQIGGHRA